MASPYFLPKTFHFLLAQAKDNKLTTPVQDKAKQNVAVHVATLSRRVVNLYSKHDETVNKVHSGITFVG